MRSMTLAQATQILDCKEQFSSQIIQGYCVDSRLLNKGELFFALKGERVDGHTYLHEVKEKGAIAAVVSRDYQGNIQGLPLLYVEDPLYALQDLAKAAIASSTSRVVAITGSLGKTSIKEFIKNLLEEKYSLFASPGNSNSQIGMPLSILNHSQGSEDIFILEMGMTLPGHIRRLVEIAPPEVAVLANVALVHACNFDRLEDMLEQKPKFFLIRIHV